MSRSFYGRVAISDTLTDLLSGLEEAAPAIADQAVLAGAEIIREAAHDNANVSKRDAGHALDGRHMRDCIEVALVDKTGTVSNARIFIDPINVPYAVHQEFGPNGNAFMRRAVDETRDEVHVAMQAVVTEALGVAVTTGTQVRFRGVA